MKWNTPNQLLQTPWRGYGIAAGLLILLVLIPVWMLTALHEYHNYDLGIFAQALHKLGLRNLNPFIPALDLPLFSDHFDPILLLFAPLARCMEPAYAALLIEHLLLLLTPLPLLLTYRKQPELAPLLCFSAFYLLFNRGMLSALTFPVHPTTWAAFFILCLHPALQQKRIGPLLLSAVLFMACKEEFPFAVLMLSAYCFTARKPKAGAWLLFLSLVWLAAAFLLRPLLLDYTRDYASRVLGPFFANPFVTIWNRLRAMSGARNLFRSLIPLLPLLWTAIRQKSTWNWAPAWMLLPLLAIRFLDSAWGFHYLAPVTPLLLLLFFSASPPKLSAKAAALSIALVLLSGSGPLSKTAATYSRLTELRGERRLAIEAARRHLLDHPEGSALVHGNLTPLLARRGQVFQFGGVQADQPHHFYLLEIPPAGNPWPRSHEDVLRKLETLRRDPELTLLQDDHLLFFAQRRLP